MTYAIYVHSPKYREFFLAFVGAIEADSPAEALALAKADGISAPLVSLAEGVIEGVMQ